MQLKVPLSPQATIERALARAVVAQGLWAAAGTGLGRTPSARAKARMVTLRCSDPAMLADWGYLATGAGGRPFLSLPALLVDVLPRLAELERFVGIDWIADPVRPGARTGRAGPALAPGAQGGLRAPGGRARIGVDSAGDGRTKLPDLEAAAGSGARGLLGRARPRRTADRPSLAGRGCSRGAAGCLLRPVAGVGAETDRLVAAGFCEGDGGIEVEAGELFGDSVEAPVRAGASA